MKQYVIRATLIAGWVLAVLTTASIGVRADRDSVPSGVRLQPNDVRSVRLQPNHVRSVRLQPHQNDGRSVRLQPDQNDGRSVRLQPDVPDQALVQKYCVTCHNSRTKTGGITFEEMNPADAASHAEVWEKALVKLRGGMMPPQGMPRPNEATLESFITALEATLDQPALKNPDPGHKPVHRLNRTEYGNAVRDLLDLQIDVADLLPADDESHGFDNIAGVLRVSPSLLEQYLSAAKKISALAVGTDNDVVRLAYQIPPDDSQTDHVEGLPLGTRGGLLVTHHFP